MQLFKSLGGQLMQIMHINFAATEAAEMGARERVGQTSWPFVLSLAKTFANKYFTFATFLAA